MNEDVEDGEGIGAQVAKLFRIDDVPAKKGGKDATSAEEAADGDDKGESTRECESGRGRCVLALRVASSMRRALRVFTLC